MRPLAALVRDTWGWKLGPPLPSHLPTHGSMNSAEKEILQKQEASLGWDLWANLPKEAMVAVSGFKMFPCTSDAHVCLGFLCCSTSTAQLVTLVITSRSALGTTSPKKSYDFPTGQPLAFLPNPAPLPPCPPALVPLVLPMLSLHSSCALTLPVGLPRLGSSRRRWVRLSLLFAALHLLLLLLQTGSCWL